MEPAEKKIFSEKKQFRDMKNKQEIQKKLPKNTKQWILVNQYLQDAIVLTECIEYHPLFVKQF